MRCGATWLLLTIGVQAFASAPPNRYRPPSAAQRAERIAPEFGWREGPMLSIGVAMLQNNRDTNIISGEHFGDPIDAALQFGFGWGINEKVTAGLDIRYANPHATFDGEPRSETSARVDLIGKYALLPQWGQLRSNLMVTPYLKGGALLYAAIVRGGARDESKVAAYGTGLLAGGGLEADFGQHPTLVLDLGLDIAMVVLDGKKVSGVTVTASGVSPQIGGALSCGIRF